LEGVHRNTLTPNGISQTVRPLKAYAAYWRVITRF
jgi:hypothetical protein